MKIHGAAIVAIPPEDAWEPIQAIRRVHDRQISRWMPHVTLLYPFLEVADPALLENAAPAFDARLERFSFFEQGRNATLWLAPEPRGAFVALQRELQKRFPSCDDVSRFPSGFTPHLSVGQCALAEAPRLRDALQAAWSPIAFRLGAIALIRRRGEEPFEVERRVPLA